MRWVTKFLETGDVYKATEYAYQNRKLNPSLKHTLTTNKENKPLINRTISEIMKQEDSFSDGKILNRAADLYYASENESTAVQMFGHLARIKGWNAPEKAVNVNINKDIGGESDAELLETLDTIIAREEGGLPVESYRTEETGADFADELTPGDGEETGEVGL